MTAQTPCKPSTEYAMSVIRDIRGQGACPPDCGAMPRWHVAQTEHRREQFVVRELADAGFVTHLPLILERRRQTPWKLLTRHQRQAAPVYVTVPVPMFPGYLFVQFDVERDPWGAILRAAGVKRLFQTTSMQPHAVPRGVVEALIAGADERLMLRSVEPLIAIGAQVLASDGPFLDHVGRCLWSDETRVRVLLSVLGRNVEIEMPRRNVRVV